MNLLQSIVLMDLWFCSDGSLFDVKTYVSDVGLVIFGTYGSMVFYL